MILSQIQSSIDNQAKSFNIGTLDNWSSHFEIVLWFAYRFVLMGSHGTTQDLYYQLKQHILSSISITANIPTKLDLLVEINTIWFHKNIKIKVACRDYWHVINNFLNFNRIRSSNCRNR